MAKKKASLTLFELMQRYQARQRQGEMAQPAGQTVPQASVADGQTGLVIRLGLAQAIIAAGAIVIVLLFVFLLGRTSAGLGPQAATGLAKPPPQAVAERTDLLANLLPDPATERGLRDSPVQETQARADRASGLSMIGGDKSAELRIPPGDREGELLAQAMPDPRQSGLNYVVVQNIHRSGTRQAALDIQRYLGLRGIDTLIVSGERGGWKVVTKQGFDLKNAADKTKCERVKAAIRRAGKLYHSAEYRGGYDFADCYLEKYTGPNQ